MVKANYSYYTYLLGKKKGMHSVKKPLTERNEPEKKKKETAAGRGSCIGTLWQPKSDEALKDMPGKSKKLLIFEGWLVGQVLWMFSFACHQIR